MLIEPLFETFHVPAGLLPESVLSGILISHPEHAGPEAVGPVIIFRHLIVSVFSAGGRKPVSEFLHILFQDCTHPVQFLRNPPGRFCAIDPLFHVLTSLSFFENRSYFPGPLYPSITPCFSIFLCYLDLNPENHEQLTDGRSVPSPHQGSIPFPSAGRSPPARPRLSARPQASLQIRRRAPSPS